MTFYINGNLSPTEAIRMHEELQVHPIIADWADKAEIFDDEYERGYDDGYESGRCYAIECHESNLKDRARDIFNDQSLVTAEDIKDALKELINE